VSAQVRRLDVAAIEAANEKDSHFRRRLPRVLEADLLVVEREDLPVMIVSAFDHSLECLEYCLS
jgi:hypothetical protein